MARIYGNTIRSIVFLITLGNTIIGIALSLIDILKPLT